VSLSGRMSPRMSGGVFANQQAARVVGQSVAAGAVCGKKK
jgi:hypothetical protein